MHLGQGSPGDHQPSISRSRRSVLNFKFSVLTFSRSMSCSMSIEQKEVKFLNPIDVKCERCTGRRFVFKNSGISSLALIFNISNPSKAMLEAKKQFQVWRTDDSCSFFFFISIQIDGSVVKASCSEARGCMGSNLAGC